MADLQVKLNNYGLNFFFTVLNADGSITNLVNYTITLEVWAQNSNSLLWSHNCTILSAPGGFCGYIVQNGDFPNTGLYNAELLLTQPGIFQETRTFTIWVSPAV